ncbi:hypothetical protein, partial [Variovorax sp. WS11]|uniref:hypothetical protein n=1 Tax=Variovorax sp. WS11 TaxID=1105204 RepID=UPI001C633B63
RTPHRLRDRRAERPRCYSVPVDAAQRDILNFSDINLKGQRKLSFFLCQLLLVKFNNLKHQGLEITIMLRTVSVHPGDVDRTLCS